jgi:hypothetical protein
MVPVVTGKYEVTGKSRGASTAKRTVGGAALGAIIGAVADGGQGARQSVLVLAQRRKSSLGETR